MFSRLNKEFNFEWDLAADKFNTKCLNFYSKEVDALTFDWDGSCWLNPPYGDGKNKLQTWVKYAYHQSLLNPHLTVVMLIPARTNTKWFHEYCMKAREIRFICGRPKFGNASHGLPQPLCLVVFQQTNKPCKISSYYLD